MLVFSVFVELIWGVLFVVLLVDVKGDSEFIIVDREGLGCL